MHGLAYATLCNGLPRHLCRSDGVVPLDVSMAVDLAEVQHLVNQMGDAIAIVYHLLADGLQLLAINFHVGAGQHLGES